MNINKNNLTKKKLIPSRLFIILILFLLVDPSVASEIEIVLRSVDTDWCREVLVVGCVGVIEVKTVPCGEVLSVVPVCVVEVKTVPCGEVLLVVSVRAVEVGTVSCGKTLLVVPVGVVYVVPGLWNVTLSIFSYFVI